MGRSGLDMHSCLCRGVPLVQRAHTRMQVMPLISAMRATFQGRGLGQSANFKPTTRILVRESHTPPWVRPSRKGLLDTFLSKTVQVGVSWHLSHSEVQDGVS